MLYTQGTLQNTYKFLTMVYIPERENEVENIGTLRMHITIGVGRISKRE